MCDRKGVGGRYLVEQASVSAGFTAIDVVLNERKSE
jgi:hypothetical protein